MIGFDAVIFDFDGVLLDSEFEINAILAALLTDLGHPHTVEQTLGIYVGLSGADFVTAIEQRIGASLPPEFHRRMKEASVRALEQGIDAVAGAVDFVRSLPPFLPKAVASSSSTRWIRGPSRPGPRACRARQARSRHLPPRGVAAGRRHSAVAYHRRFGDRGERRTGVRGDGDRPCGRRALPRRACRHAARARG